MKTEALVLAAKDAPFVLQPIELEEPQPNEVLVQIVACGLCHTDLCIQNGTFPSAFPGIAGHEGSGIVQAVGSAVTRVKQGDHVLLSFSSCTRCAYCRDGHPAGCSEFVEYNFGRKRNDEVGDRGVGKDAEGKEVKGSFFGQSAFGRHALVLESSCVVVPKGTDLTMLAPLGCGLQTGAGAILNILRPSPSSSLAIFGLGAVGMAALFSAKHLGVSNIIVVDVVLSRLELAKSFGAHHAFNGRDADLIDQIRGVTNGLGARYAVEATGHLKVLETAYKSLSNFGHLASIGTPGPGPQPPWQIHDHVNSSRTHTGVAEGDSNPPEFIPLLMRLYEEGKFPVDKISKVFRVEEFDQAVRAMHDGSVIKPIILF